MRVSYQQIYKSEKKCSKSKRKGSQCQRFHADLIDNLFEIQQVLQSKTYLPKPMRVFVADNGSKPREIYTPHYYDRVIHHILVPRLEKIIAHKFIHDSTANQKNKGTHFAVARLQKMMRKNRSDSSCSHAVRGSKSGDIFPNNKIHSHGEHVSEEATRYCRVRTCVSAHIKRNINVRYNTLSINEPVFDKKEHTQVLRYKRQQVDRAKHALPNSRGSANEIAGLRYPLHQPTARTNLFKQSKLKPQWCECHQANLPKVLKTLQSNSVSYVVVTQQGYVNNKLRKRKVSQIYISNNLNPKEAI